jgi:benzil reductase ((S)-benzoin forming)
MRALLVVTGGSAGLGRALLAAAPAGTHRVDVSRSGPPPEADEHLAVDLATPEGWAVAGDAVAARVDAGPWDRVTLIHSAGTIAPIGFAGEVDPAAYTANLLLNAAAGPAIGSRFLTAVAHLGIPRELALISSGAARSAYAGWSAYGAGKAAGDQWVRAVGEEQRRRGGVRVLGIAPGVVATGMQATIRGTDPDDFPAVERFRRLHADGALLDADEVAGRIWDVLDDQQVATGSVLDLRDR